MNDLMDKTIMMKRVKAIALMVVIIVAFAGGMLSQKALTDMLNKKEVTTQYIAGKLEDVSELITQQVTYSAEQKMEEGTIPFITQKGFTMTYNATMKAGIKMENADIKIGKKVIKVILPHAEVLSNQVNPSSIQFTGEKNAVLNWKDEEDVAEALAAAEADVENNPRVDYADLLVRAEEHAEKLVHKLLDDAVGEMEVKVEFR